MIEKIEDFINEFINLEQIVRILDRENESPEDFNKKLLELEKMVVPEMKNKLGVVFKKPLILKMLNQKQVDKSEEELAEIIQTNENKLNKRILFKISEIKEGVFKVFTSFPNPRGNSYGECFIVQKQGDAFLITTLYFLRSDDRIKYHWKYNSGDDSFTFGNETPISIKKYEEPENDEKSIFFQNQDSL